MYPFKKNKVDEISKIKEEIVAPAVDNTNPFPDFPEEKSQLDEIVDSMNTIIKYIQNHEARLKRIEERGLFVGIKKD